MRANKTSWAGTSLQHNYLAELGFSVLANKWIAIMCCANVPTAMRYHIFPKSFETSTLLEVLVVADIAGKKQSRYKYFFEK